MTVIPKLAGIATPGRASSASMIAVVSDEATLQAIYKAVPGGRQAVEVHRGNLREAVKLVDGITPAFLIVDIGDNEDPVGDMVELASHCDPETTLVALGTRNDIALYRGLVGAGVSEYLLKPVSHGELRRALLTASTVSPEPVQGKSAEICVMLGARGGVGTTALATSLAWHIAQGGSRKVGLLDLDINFGTVALNLDLQPSSGLRNALVEPQRIDSLFVSSAMVNAGDNFQILVAEEAPEEPIVPHPEALDMLLAELRGLFDVLVVDLPRHWLSHATTLLGEARCVGVVTDLSIAGLRDSLRLRTSLADLAPEARRLLIANRVGREKRVELPPAQFAKSVGAKIDIAIPEEVQAAVAALDGRPLIAGAGRGRLRDGIRALEEAFIGEPVKRKRGWLRLVK